MLAYHFLATAKTNKCYSLYCDRLCVLLINTEDCLSVRFSSKLSVSRNGRVSPPELALFSEFRIHGPHIQLFIFFFVFVIVQCETLSVWLSFGVSSVLRWQVGVPPPPDYHSGCMPPYLPLFIPVLHACVRWFFCRLTSVGVILVTG